MAKSKPTPKSHAEIAAEQENEAYAEMRRQRAEPTAGVATLPFGKEHNLSEWDDVKDEFTDPKEFIYHPEKLLAKPRPGMHYAWPLKDGASTQASIAAGMYRPIKKEELDRSKAYEITSYKGIDDYVYWEMHILVEMSHEVWVMLYRAPEKK